ncbi:MAG TPA: 50S ribosomal protein L32, partial [Candidatus Methylomirabilis sp.]|nr:50S ribosomal protein L32 [Candidatus Methylomirabilis sp.]
MPLPKRRHSNARSRKRRAHDAISTAGLSRCPNCQAMTPPHRACRSCGHYRGREVVK